MANIRSGNTWYVDTAHASAADDLAVTGLQVVAIVATATSSSGTIVLADATSGATKLSLRIDPANSNANGGTQFYSFDAAPLQFPNGIKVTTLTNAVATIVTREQGK